MSSDGEPMTAGRAWTADAQPRPLSDRELVALPTLEAFRAGYTFAELEAAYDREARRQRIAAEWRLTRRGMAVLVVVLAILLAIL